MKKKLSIYTFIIISFLIISSSSYSLDWGFAYYPTFSKISKLPPHLNNSKISYDFKSFGLMLMFDYYFNGSDKGLGLLFGIGLVQKGYKAEYTTYSEDDPNYLYHEEFTEDYLFLHNLLYLKYRIANEKCGAYAAAGFSYDSAYMG